MEQLATWVATIAFGLSVVLGVVLMVIYAAKGVS